MKYLILHGYGLADVAHRDLGGKTPLEAANTPALDRLAASGEFGAAIVPPEAAGWKGEALPLVVLGYDPAKCYPGPAPFEATGLGVALGEHDVAFRCHMVSLRSTPHEGSTSVRAEVRKLGSHLTLDDTHAGGIDTEMARELLDAVNEQLGSETIQFYPGIGHRHFMVWVDGKARAACHAPHDVLNKPIGDFLPAGDGSDILRQVMESAFVILRDHPVNTERRDSGLKPANCLWLWGQGRSPNLTKLTETRGLTGAVITASDLARGVGTLAGLDAVDPAEFMSNGELNLAAQRDIALRELRRHDIVYVHVGAEDVANGRDPKAKLQRVEEFDRVLVGPLLDGLAALGAHRVLAICDHGHGAEIAETPIPYVLFEGPVKAASAAKRFTEAAAAAQPNPRDVVRLAGRLLPKV